MTFTLSGEYVRSFVYDISQLPKDFLGQMRERLGRYNKGEKFPVKDYAPKLYSGKKKTDNSKPESLERDLYKKFKSAPIHGISSRKSRGVSINFQQKVEWETRSIIYSLIEFYENYDMEALKEIDDLFFSGKAVVVANNQNGENGENSDSEAEQEFQGPQIGFDTFPCELCFKIDLIDKNALQAPRRTIERKMRFWQLIKRLYEIDNRALTILAHQLLKQYSRNKYFDMNCLKLANVAIREIPDFLEIFPIRMADNASEKISSMVLRSVRQLEIDPHDNNDNYDNKDKLNIESINSALNVAAFRNEMSTDFNQLSQKLDLLMEAIGGTSRWTELYRKIVKSEVAKIQQDHIGRIDDLATNVFSPNSPSCSNEES